MTWTIPDHPLPTEHACRGERVECLSCAALTCDGCDDGGLCIDCAGDLAICCECGEVVERLDLDDDLCATCAREE